VTHLHIPEERRFQQHHCESLESCISLEVSQVVEALPFISEYYDSYTLSIWEIPGSVLELKDIYLLTPWSRVLLEKLTGLQLVKKFPEFYGARKFLTALTSAHHLSLS
jgi:hypothetical protein